MYRCEHKEMVIAENVIEEISLMMNPETKYEVFI